MPKTLTRPAVKARTISVRRPDLDTPTTMTPPRCWNAGAPSWET